MKKAKASDPAPKARLDLRVSPVLASKLKARAKKDGNSVTQLAIILLRDGLAR